MGGKHATRFDNDAIRLATIKTANSFEAPGLLEHIPDIQAAFQEIEKLIAEKQNADKLPVASPSAMVAQISSFPTNGDTDASNANFDCDSADNLTEQQKMQSQLLARASSRRQEQHSFLQISAGANANPRSEVCPWTPLNHRETRPGGGDLPRSVCRCRETICSARRKAFGRPVVVPGRLNMPPPGGW